MKAYEIEFLSTLRRLLIEGVAYTGRGTISERKGLWQIQHRVPLTENGKPFLPLLTVRKPLVKWMVEELRWMLSGSTHEPHLTNGTVANEYDPSVFPMKGHSCERGKGPTIWAEWATKEQCAKFGRQEGDLGPVYGHAWRNAEASRGIGGYFCPVSKRWINGEYAEDGIDQLARLMEGLEKNPFGTRHILSGWIPSDVDSVCLPPCHTLLHFCVRPAAEGKLTLHSHLYQRSADYALGVPANMAFYCLLTHLVARALGYEPGEFVHTMGDCHLYGNQYEEASRMLEREPLGAPEILALDLHGETPLDRVLNFTYDQLKLSKVNFHECERIAVNV
jgi:thymidylate synthase